MKKIVMLSAVIASSALAITPEQIKERGYLKVGVFEDMPPVGYAKDGKYDGFDVRLAHHFAHDLLGDASKVEFIPVQVKERIPALRTEQVDIVLANFSVNPTRAKEVYFAKPYMQATIGVISRENAPITELSQLNDKTLLALTGTIGSDYFFKKYPKVKISKIDTSEVLYDEFKAGKGDALTQDTLTIFTLAAQNKGFVVGVPVIPDTAEMIAPAVNKGDKELLEWVNKEIETLQKDGRLVQIFEETMRPLFGNKIKPEEVLVLQ